MKLQEFINETLHEVCAFERWCQLRYPDVKLADLSKATWLREYTKYATEGTNGESRNNIG